MTETTVELEAFHIAGIAVRTTNQNGQSQSDIGTLWQRFFSEGIIEKIPGKLGQDIYCIYTDYESDLNGPYTTILGCRVASPGRFPAGLVSRMIPGSKYRVFMAKGKLPEAVVNTWKQIWESGIERKYAADFDLYGPAAQNPADAEVEVYVSVG
jgi:predicted transcriptional regulator YdeE